ncbi:hypothetical protein GGR92_005232 [Spirosoma lacussanchae]|uniref:hypothetical protein n=1 Tax=Spirosoma lacussanchae TaxID=1884249 RepID=UPI0011090AF0|nr:hypothetical protein [Spirosoma lacussanchae]
MFTTLRLHTNYNLPVVKAALEMYRDSLVKQLLEFSYIGNVVNVSDPQALARELEIVNEEIDFITESMLKSLKEISAVLG